MNTVQVSVQIGTKTILINNYFYYTNLLILLLLCNIFILDFEYRYIVMWSTLKGATLQGGTVFHQCVVVNYKQ